MKNVALKEWKYIGDKVHLVYDDETEVFVSKKDFNRAFGCIVSASKEDVIRDFSIKENAESKYRLIEPSEYLKILESVLGFLQVRTKSDVTERGLRFESEVVERGDIWDWYQCCFDGKDGFVGSVDVFTKSEANYEVIETKVNIPLFFEEDHEHVPNYKMMEHFERCAEAFCKAVKCYAVVGPVFDSTSDPIDWKPDADFKKIEEENALKYKELIYVRFSVGSVVYAFLDSENNLWLLELGTSEFVRDPDNPDDEDCITLCLRKINNQDNPIVGNE